MRRILLEIADKLRALLPECAAEACDTVPRNADVCGCSELVGVEGSGFARAMIGQNFVAGRGEGRARARVSDDLIPAAVVCVEEDHLDIDRPLLRRRFRELHLTVLILPLRIFIRA